MGDMSEGPWRALTSQVDDAISTWVASHTASLKADEAEIKRLWGIIEELKIKVLKAEEYAKLHDADGNSEQQAWQVWQSNLSRRVWQRNLNDMSRKLAATEAELEAVKGELAGKQAAEAALQQSVADQAYEAARQAELVAALRTEVALLRAKAAAAEQQAAPPAGTQHAPQQANPQVGLLTEARGKNGAAAAVACASKLSPLDEAAAAAAKVTSAIAAAQDRSGGAIGGGAPTESTAEAAGAGVAEPPPLHGHQLLCEPGLPPPKAVRDGRNPPAAALEPAPQQQQQQQPKAQQAPPWMLAAAAAIGASLQPWRPVQELTDSPSAVQPAGSAELPPWLRQRAKLQPPGQGERPADDADKQQAKRQKCLS